MVQREEMTGLVCYRILARSSQPAVNAGDSEVVGRESAIDEFSA